MLRYFLVATALAGASVLPASASGLSAAKTVERQVTVRGPDGRARPAWTPAMEAESGDRLRYTLQYRNMAREELDGTVLAMPVPPGVSYVEGTALESSAAVTFSADGGESFAPREALSVPEGEGARPAEAGEITHIRWTFAGGVLPGEAGTVSFEAIVR